MLQNKKIAFFIDVDNLVLSSEHYANIMEQLNGMGKILYGKIYGAGERKHKEIYTDAATHCYDTDRQMRVKRRGKRDFDNRIFVDVVDAVAKAPAIDAVCVVAQPTDLVYLYSYLRRRGISVIALDNLDEACSEFVDEFVELGKVEELKLPASKPKKAPRKAAPKAEPAPAPKAETAPQVAPAKAKSSADIDSDTTLELLEEIRRLREEAAAKEQAHKAAEAPVVEQPAPQPKKVEEPVQQAAPAPVEELEEVDEPAPISEPATSNRPRAQYAAGQSSSAELIRMVEELRRNNDAGDSDELLKRISELLDEVD